jgi:hypothetical protein
MTSGGTGHVVAGGLDFYDDTANEHRMVITSAGKVGIGTSAPTLQLSVGSTTNTSRVEVGTSDPGSWQSNVYSYVSVGVSGSHVMACDSSGLSSQWFNIYDTGTKYRTYAGYGANWYHSPANGDLVYRTTTTTAAAGSSISDLTAKVTFTTSGSATFAGAVTSQSTAKFWCWSDDFSTIVDGYNASGVTDLSTGLCRISFEWALPSTGYCLVGSCHYGGGTNDVGIVQWEVAGLLTSSVTVNTKHILNDGTGAFVLFDAEEVMLVIFDS